MDEDLQLTKISPFQFQFPIQVLLQKVWKKLKGGVIHLPHPLKFDQTLDLWTAFEWLRNA